MNKNLLKIGALSLSLLAFGLMFTNAADETGQVSLTINTGESICDYGTDLTFTAQEAQLDSGYVFQSNFLTGVGQTNTWSCVDRAAKNAWTFYVAASDLLLSGDISVTIANSGIAILYEAGIGEGDTSDCTVENETVWNTLNTSVEMMKRTYTTKGVCKVNVTDVELRVTVPQNQTPGTYTSTFTVTLPNF